MVQASQHQPVGTHQLSQMTQSHPAQGLLSQELRKTAQSYCQKINTTGLTVSRCSGRSWLHGGFTFRKFTELYTYDLCTFFVCFMLHLQSLP